MPVLKTAGSFLLDALKTYAMYLAIVVVGTGVLMLVADSIGYRSYADRPGTGWYGFHPNLNLEDVKFVVGFVLLTAYLSLGFIAVPGLILLTVALRRSTVHRAIIALVLVPSFGLVTLLLVSSAGWFVAIDGAVVLIATALSILFSVAVSGTDGVRVSKFRIRVF